MEHAPRNKVRELLRIAHERDLVREWPISIAPICPVELVLLS